MTNLVVLAAFPLVFGAHMWAHPHGGRGVPAPAAVPPAAHAPAVPGAGDDHGTKGQPSGAWKAPVQTAEPRTIHYAVIPIDCRYLTKAAKARMCGHPIMRGGPSLAKPAAPR